MPDPILKTYASQAAAHFERAGNALAARQVADGAARGHVPPWPGAHDADFQGTLAAIWIWSRHQALTGDLRFAHARTLGWSFVEQAWRRFIPQVIDSEAGDEAAYDCALALRAFRAERALAATAPVTAGGPLSADGVGGRGVAAGRDGDRPVRSGEGPQASSAEMQRRAALADQAAGALAAYLAGLQELGGRDFRDPGFLAWNLVEYARALEDQRLLSVAQRFVERAFGMQAPPSFAAEPEADAGLFDFSSTTAMRVLAILASEGSTPFVGAWLRERVASAIPPGFVSRALDEGCWNACVAACTGRAYVVSTDPRFLDAYLAVSAELERREVAGDGTLGPSAGDERDDGRHSSAGQSRAVRGGPHPHTLATFYSALAADALVRTDHAPLSAPSASRPGQAFRPHP